MIFSDNAPEFIHSLKKFGDLQQKDQSEIEQSALVSFLRLKNEK